MSRSVVDSEQRAYHAQTLKEDVYYSIANTSHDPKDPNTAAGTQWPYKYLSQGTEGKGLRLEILTHFLSASPYFNVTYPSMPAVTTPHSKQVPTSLNFP